MEGTVRFKVIVGVDGAVRHIEYRSGQGLLVGEAGQALQKWKYQPTYVDGKPVEVQADVDVVFKLPQ